ncbi:FUSC family protein [Streptomyces sp. CB01881]|uniref:FUSC family protein n=1 Tax=Streptomyces sp. CB01881 TaxID=2078691 RepID=UPI001F4F79CC|nr:FUSC family protein [Streptomyces sp. CB01881]
MHRPEIRPPDWLLHPLRRQSGPFPWGGVLRGALGMGPLLVLAVAAGQPQAGVLAGLAAMFGGINDRPGTARSAAALIGLPALAGAAGLLIGQAPGWWAVPLLAVVGVVCGAVSVTGPVCSAAGVQLLVLTALGCGMPMAGPAWVRAGWYLLGGAWFMMLRLAVRPTAQFRPLHGERQAVAGVFDALAEALRAAGTPGAERARRGLTVALDRADEALRLQRLLRRPGRRRPDELRLDERFAAAAALCEASVALLWEGETLPARALAGPRRLAEAVRGDTQPGRLPVPLPESPARSAFDRAVLAAGLAFDQRPEGHPSRGAEPGSGHGPEPGTGHGPERGAGHGPERGAGHGHVAGPPAAPRRRPVPVRPRRGIHPAGPTGRECGLRVGACVAVTTALALLLHADHWYWLPATAAFLVKPDYGPLFSRVVNRFAGTAAGVLLFAGTGSLAAGTVPGLPVLVVAVCGALIAPSLRHFALQTGVVTLTVLAFVSLGDDTQAAASRLADTALACAVVLVVGHLPRLVDTRARVGHRCAEALRHTQHYLHDVLTGPAGPETEPGAEAGRRDRLRRRAYRSLAEARVSAETVRAELLADPGEEWLKVAVRAERIADAATACAVRLAHGCEPPGAVAVGQLVAAVGEVADALDGRCGPVVARPEVDAVPPDCRTLGDIVAELHGIQDRQRAMAGAAG